MWRTKTNSLLVYYIIPDVKTWHVGNELRNNAFRNNIVHLANFLKVLVFSFFACIVEIVQGLRYIIPGH